MPSTPPVRLWVVPHQPRTRGEPTVRPLLGSALHCPDNSLPLVREAGGRPRLCEPFERFDAGWSHSGALLVLALGEGLELGVDVEQLRPRLRMPEIAARFFHEDEARWLRAQPAHAATEAFVRLWCAKEAVLKAHGQGLSFGLHRLVFAEHAEGLRLVRCDPALGHAGDWTLHEWSPQQDYRAALAWRPRPPAQAQPL